MIRLAVILSLLSFSSFADLTKISDKSKLSRFISLDQFGSLSRKIVAQTSVYDSKVDGITVFSIEGSKGTMDGSGLRTCLVKLQVNFDDGSFIQNASAHIGNKNEVECKDLIEGLK